MAFSQIITSVNKLKLLPALKKILFGQTLIMPIYEYEHIDKPCLLGKVFEVKQSIQDEALNSCPNCAGSVRKLISRTNISTPKSDRELRDHGFTKLVRRDDGVYENVTARDGDSKVVLRDKPETLPDFKKTISD